MSSPTVQKQPVSLFMTTGELVTATATDSVADVLALLDGASVGHIPILDEAGALVGVLTLADAARALHPKQAVALDTTPVREIMTRNLETVAPTSTLGHAAGLFAEGSFHSLLVTGTEGELVGILTSSDTIRALAGLESPSPLDP